MKAAILAVSATLAVSCGEDRTAAVPPAGEVIRGNRQSDLQPGPAIPARTVANPFEGDEKSIAEGKRLYAQFNCAGCHASGGGAIGPPLMDDEWIYGSGPGNIFWTIIEGRPQGMPSFGGRIAENEVWRIVAYVRSLSNLHKQNTASGRQHAGTVTSKKL